MAKHVMISDDEEDIVETVKMRLEACGYEVSTTMGKHTVGDVRTKKPDLLLLDVIMPGKNGFQVCRDLKSNPKTRRMPIIIVTSKGEDADVFWGRKQGADEYLTKPFGTEVLLGAVDRLLGIKSG